LETVFEPPSTHPPTEEPEEDEEDGTAKAANAPTLTPSPSAQRTADARSQNRLSSMFSVESWLPASPSPPTNVPEKKRSVSAPVGPDSESEDEEVLDDDDNLQFQKMIVRRATL
jgi:hypothetical protein